ncbi:hypothetical protein [uncultured Clostridium sp.]|uniref:hypothetical protein n=1 Tax=uncultured Clostridium sp. TaxID=59620 RepID=UPI002604F4D3|nr:hypothetical protein [uncultured Clostridium sp.]MCI9110279.1 hypothetical protein [Bacilli bacterium]
MKIILSSDEKPNADILLNFIKNLSEKEKIDFSVFIKGFELGKLVGANSKPLA